MGSYWDLLGAERSRQTVVGLEVVITITQRKAVKVRRQGHLAGHVYFPTYVPGHVCKNFQSGTIHTRKKERKRKTSRSNGVKNSPANVGDAGLIPGLGRSPGEGNGNPLQYYCLEKSHGQRSLASYSAWGHKRVRHDLVTKQKHRQKL